MMRRFLMAAAFASLACAAARAGSPCVAVSTAPPVVQYQQQQTLTVAVLPAVFVPLPSYTVGISHAPGDDGKLDEILRRLESIEAAKPSVTPSPTSPVPVVEKETAAAIYGAACVRCHAAAVAVDKGGGYAFDASSLTPEQKQKNLEAVVKGEMPKGGPLARSKVATILREHVK